AGKLKSIEASTAFLAAAPRDSWPARGHGATGDAPDYAPATGRTALADGERDRLAARLDELAASLVGGALFKHLFSLLTSELPDRKPTFAFVARDGEQRHVHEYAPTRCGFEAVAPDGD